MLSLKPVKMPHVPCPCVHVVADGDVVLVTERMPARHADDLEAFDRDEAGAFEVDAVAARIDGVNDHAGVSLKRNAAEAVPRVHLEAPVVAGADHHGIAGEDRVRRFL